jgi:hypothetical protein
VIGHDALGDVQADSGTVIFGGKKGIKYFFAQP